MSLKKRFMRLLLNGKTKLVTDKKFSAIFWQEMKIQIPQSKNITQRREGAKITQRRKKERFSSNQEQFYQYHPFAATLKLG